MAQKLTFEQKIKAEQIMMYTYMDYHLAILHEAIEKGDAEAQTLQLGQLEKTRERLIELGYFTA